MCHICATWKCAIYQHVPCASAAAAGADETKVLQHSKNQPPPISTSSFLASHQHPTFSTKRKPLPCWIDSFVVHIISVVTYGSFNMLGGILNHDIFLFVPNISTKALPVQKISRKLVWVQIDLIYLYNSLKSKVLNNKMVQFFINRFSPKICHSFEVLLIGWEASL